MQFVHGMSHIFPDLEGSTWEELGSTLKKTANQFFLDGRERDERDEQVISLSSNSRKSEVRQSIVIQKRPKAR